METILNSRKRHYVAKVCILLIMVSLMAGMVGCGGGVAVEYDLTMVVTPPGSGTATDLANTSPYTAGTVISIKAVAAAGYQFANWTAAVGTFANPSAAETVFTMPAQDVTITANFEATSRVLLSDDFSDDAGPWDTFSNSLGSVFYEDGWLHVVDYTDSSPTWTGTHQDFTDFILEVETKFVGGTTSNWHFVGCRVQDSDDAYGFGISADGYYGILRYLNGNEALLVEATASSYINQGVGVVNLIHIECIGSNLNLSVNGHVLRTVTDTAIRSGDIVLGAWSLADSSTEIAFDNILVTEATAEVGPESTPMVSAGGVHTVGLKSDGAAVAVGPTGGGYDYGQCEVYAWTGIAQVSAGGLHTVGLKADGTVVAVGYNYYGQCDVGGWGWADIIQVSAGLAHTVALKADGTVVAVGLNGDGECDVDAWAGITQVSAGLYHTVGLRTDDTVVAVGNNDYGQCDVGNWTGIVRVAAGAYHTLGLKADGTVVAVGNNDYGQCDVGNWTGIVQVAAGGLHTVGLKADGTVVAVGLDDDGECDVDAWTNIVQVAAGEWHTVGLKNNGTVVAAGNDDYGQCDVSGWDLN
jgi:hypothetical protein